MRILSGEESIWIAGSEQFIRHRVSRKGNDQAAEYIKTKLLSYKLDIYDQVYSLKGRNILAIKRGSVHPEIVYLICAHYDAVANHCADDNASGVAAVLEAARILSQYDFEYTLVFAFFDEEETGRWGSRHFASEIEVFEIDLKGVINVDMIGWDSDNDGMFDIHTQDVANSNEMAQMIVVLDSLYQFDLNPIIVRNSTLTSDQKSFWEYYYGAVLIIEGHTGNDFNANYHRSEDRVEHFNLNYFYRLSQLSIASTATLIVIADK